MTPEEQKPKENQYEEILKDRSKLFHGIGFDIFKLNNILEHGILSENAAKEKGIGVIRNVDGYNLDNTVSISESPSVNNTFNHGAFKIYIKGGLGFVIDGIKLDGKHAFKAPQISEEEHPQASGFPDEAYVVHEVPRQNIVGILVPEEALDKRLSDLPLGLIRVRSKYIEPKVRALIQAAEDELGYKGDTVLIDDLLSRQKAIDTSSMSNLEKMNRRDQLHDEIDIATQSYLEKAYALKLGKETVTLRDLLSLLPVDLPIYNSDGNPIKLEPNPR